MTVQALKSSLRVQCVTRQCTTGKKLFANVDSVTRNPQWDRLTSSRWDKQHICKTMSLSVVRRSCKYNFTRQKELTGDVSVTPQHEVVHPRRTAPPARDNLQKNTATCTRNYKASVLMSKITQKLRMLAKIFEVRHGVAALQASVLKLQTSTGTQSKAASR